MARISSKQWRKGLLLLLIIGLLGLPIYLLAAVSRSPKRKIQTALIKAGFSEFESKFWVCVSALETQGWTSEIYLTMHNLFGMQWNDELIYGRNSYAINPTQFNFASPEGQAYFKSDQESIDDLVLYLTQRFNYPKDFVSTAAGVHYMKTKGYFTSDESQYLTNVDYWFKKLF